MILFTIFAIILLIVYAWTIYNIPILAVGVRSLRLSEKKLKGLSSPGAEEVPFVSIIIPVKDEERVMGRLLDALLRLNYPAERKEIIVVEDGSTDKTVEICNEYVRRHPGQLRLLHKSVSDGKPSALNHALIYAKGEIVAVFDGDSVPERDALLKAIKYFEDPLVAAIQGRQFCINEDENVLTKLSSYADGIRYEVYMRGKDTLNLFVQLTGSCCFVRRGVLEEVGGWDGKSLSEDLELSARLTERGYRLRYAPDVRSWQETPASAIQFFRQRSRWLRGSMEVALRYGKLVKKFERRRIDAEVTLFSPFLLIFGLILCLASPYSFASLQPNVFSTILTNATFLFTTFLLLILKVALVYVSKPLKFSNILWVFAIYFYWIIQSIVAFYVLFQILLRRPRRWAKTPKTGVITNQMPD